MPNYQDARNNFFNTVNLKYGNSISTSNTFANNLMINPSYYNLDAFKLGNTLDWSYDPNWNVLYLATKVSGNPKLPTTHGFWSSKAGNTIKGTAKNLAGPLILIGGLYMNQGAHNEVGDVLNTAAGFASAIPVYGWAASAILGTAGAVANAYTDTVNTLYEKLIAGLIGNLANITSEASDYRGLMLDYSAMQDASKINLGDISNWGSKGAFISDSNSKRRQAYDRAARALGIAGSTAIGNINARGQAINMLNTLGQLGHLSAFGGPIGGALDFMMSSDALNNNTMSTLAKNKVTALPNSFTSEVINPTMYNTFAEGGGIYIKPSKRGTFTAAAKQRGMGVLEFASKVLANKEDYSPAMVKKAVFAHNASKWNSDGGLLFANGGSMNYLKGLVYDLSEKEIARLKSLGYKLEYV